MFFASGEVEKWAILEEDVLEMENKIVPSRIQEDDSNNIKI